MEFHQLLIFCTPGIGTPVIGIGEAAHTGLVAVVDGGRPRPGHLQQHRLFEYGFAHVFLRRVRPKSPTRPTFRFRPGEKTGMVMVGQLVHGRYQRRMSEAAHVMLRGTAEAFPHRPTGRRCGHRCVFHAGQEPVTGSMKAS